MLDPSFWLHAGQEMLRTFATAALHLLGIAAGYWIVRRAVVQGIALWLGRIAMHASTVDNENRSGRLRTLQTVIQSSASYVLAFVAALMVLDVLGVNTSGLVTTAGVGGLAIGFGSQRLVRDVVSGLFLIIENHFGVGDIVQIGAASGTVEEVGLRVTRLRDDAGRIIVIANGDITSVTNHSRARYPVWIDVVAAATAEIDQIREAVAASGAELLARPESPLSSSPELLGVTAVDLGQITVRIGLPVRAHRAMDAQMAMREMVRSRLLPAPIPSVEASPREGGSDHP